MNDEPADRGAVHDGGAAWKRAQEDVAKRNEQARKAGKQERADYERDKEATRQAAERKHMGLLLDKQPKR